MHEEFKKVFKDKDLSFSTVEEGIKCPKNYLSRFINGPKPLPGKWEKKIREFLKGVAVASNAGIKPKDAEKFFQKVWVTAIEKYCLEEAGIDPEGLIEQHRSLKKAVADISKAPKVQVTDLTPTPQKSNTTINTSGRSNWMDEYRKKKLGIK
jgi:hypothetical protein